MTKLPHNINAANLRPARQEKTRPMLIGTNPSQDGRT
jgi:hypothetical protein